ncbi:hypothetical protein YB2330_006510 [Saitoella coloradoensis]
MRFHGLKSGTPHAVNGVRVTYLSWTDNVRSRLERMRQALQVAPAIDILDHIHSLPQPEQSKAEEAIRSIERRAMQEMRAGAATVLLLNDVNGHLKDMADVTIASLTELIQILEDGF